jgi:hypothetical protein
MAISPNYLRLRHLRERRIVWWINV